MKIASLTVVATLWGAAVLSGMAQAADIKVLGTPGVREFYAELVAQFEKDTGHKVSTAWAGTVDVTKRISGGEAVKQMLLAAKSIAYSSGPSGIYLAGLMQRMGIADQMKPKMKQIPPGEAVGDLVARGEAEIGFHQMSELLPVKGIDIVGPLPPDVQQITVFSAGLHAGAGNADAAQALVRFITAPAAAAVIKKH